MSTQAPTRTTSPSDIIFERVADREGVDPLELDPLAETIDPDAIDALVGRGAREANGFEITFACHGYDVTVTAAGVVDVAESAAASSASD
jgi:hypothetical protein